MDAPPVVELAESAGVARATAYARLTKLESSVITGYAARIDHEAAGLGLTAIILINGGGKSMTPLRKLLRELAQVEKAWYVTGFADVLVVVRVRDMAELRALVLEKLQKIPDIRGTRTLMALEQVVDRPYVCPTLT